MNCEQLKQKYGWSQEQFDKCVQKELDKLNLPKPSEVGIEPEEPGFIEKSVNKLLNPIKAVITVADTVLEAKEKGEKTQGLKDIKIDENTFAPEDSEDYFNEDFLKNIGKNRTHFAETTIEEEKIFSELGYDLAKNKNPNKEPSPMDVWAESNRLKQLSSKYATGETSTMIEQAFGKNAATNFIGDMVRAGETGYGAAGALESSLSVYEQGNETDDKLLTQYLEDYKQTLEANEQSDESRSFYKCYEAAGGDSLAFVDCLRKNPAMISQLGVSSLATNAASVIESQKVKQQAFAGTLSGAAVGTAAGPIIGTGVGAMSGFFFEVARMMETGLTFSELLIEATGIENPQDVTTEDLRKVLNNPEKLKDIQAKANRRGVVIGGVSAFTGGAAAKTTAALVKAGKGAKLAAGVGGTVEIIGESTGEALGMMAAGQTLDAAEIGFEGLAGLGTKAPISVGGTLLNLNQLSTNLTIKNKVKSAGFADMSSAFKPDVKTSNTQIDVAKTANAEKTLDIQLEEQQRNRSITPEEANNIKNNFKQTKAAVNRIKKLGLSLETETLTVELLKEKQNLESTIKQVNDTNLTSKQTERVNEINEELRNVSQQETQETVTQEAEGDIIAEDTKIVEKSKREIASEEVQEIYETQGREGAVEIIEKFKPIVNKIVQSRKEAPGFDAQLLTDEIETGKRGILDLIDEYDASKGVPLAAFINKQLPLRAIEASKRVLGEKFTLDVTEARGVTDGTDINVQIQEDLDIAPRTKQQQESITKLRDVAGITPEEAQIGVTETLKTKLPGVTEKNFRQKVNEANRLKFGDKVLAEMGGLKDVGRLVSFIDTNFDAIMQAIPDSVKNKQLASLFKPKKIGRAKTKVGEGIFEYATPTKQEVIDFYTTGKNTTNRARVKTLADVIAQELALDATAEVLADPKVQKEFIERQEIQGKEITKDAIPRILEAIDRQIINLQEQSNKYKGVVGLNNPKIVIDGLIIFAKTFKKVLQTTSNVKKAVEAAYKSLKKYLAGKVSTIEADIIIDEVKESVGEINKLDDATIDKIKEALTESLENYDKKQDQANFKAEVTKLINKYPDLNLKQALVDSKIYYQKTKDSPSRMDNKVADKLVLDAVKFAEAIPVEAHKALGIKGKPYTDIVGTHKRNFDIAAKKISGPDKGKPGRQKQKFDNLNLKSAAQLIADGTWSAETAAIWNSIDMSKVQPLNSKSTSLSPLLTKIKNILAGRTEAQTVSEKKSAVDKIYDSEIGLNNLKFAELNASILKDGYKNKTLSLPYILNTLQAQTNVTAGFRAFTDISGLEIIAGKVDLHSKDSNYKGEHLQSNSQTMSEIFSWIINPNSTSLELKNILSGHTQIFGDKTQLFDPIDTTFSKTSRLGAERLTRGLAKNTVESIYVPGTKTDFLTDTAQNEYKKQIKELGKRAKDVSEILEDGQKFKDSKRGKKIIEKNKEIESQDLSKGFNDIIETNKGLASEARYSEIMAKRKGGQKGKYRFFIPPSAEDFKGLLYNFLGKGKIGETQMKWFQEKLINPYNQGVAQMERYRRALKGDYATLLKEFPNVRKQLGKKVKGVDFTYDNAVRAYLWNKDGVEIPGLSKRDTKALVDAIAKNPEMKAFSEGLQLISKKPTWIKPTASWDVQSITSDIHNFTSREGRKEYLGEFIDNANEIFSTDNLNKIEGVYGTNVKEALEDSLYRMKTGINRPSGTNRLTNNFNNWVNRSIGAIMFFNRKSALLQTLSSVNFVNWSDNNPIKAAAAFANQKQYWSDVVKIFNSPKLKSRRAGLKGDINESELASAAANATNKAEAALSYLLKIGFTPTQLADSFAIATGGATFLRNRINTYKKEGRSEVEAEKQAWKDFSAISEETQQSADPSLISQQQASPLGRLILAFQNTPMQYTRLMKKAAQDLINGRGDAKTHISKIIYYGAVQNFIFAALQNALFAAIPGFSGEDDEEEETKGEIVQNRKNIRIANNMVDTVLRGSGVYGAIAATLKNTLMKYYENEKKDPFAKDNASILLEAINLSPPIGSKLRKLNNALKTKEFEKDVISERGWEMTRNGKINLSPSYRVLGSTLEAGLNIPLERALAEIDALVEMTDQRNSSLERIALALGWRTWDLQIPNEEHDQIKAETKEKKKQERKDSAARARAEKKRLAEERKYLGKTEEEIKLIKEKDSIVKTNKSDQIISLTNLGLTKKEIRELKLEEDRVEKIIELTKKK